jgi:hypothetical protein
MPSGLQAGRYIAWAFSLALLACVGIWVLFPGVLTSNFVSWLVSAGVVLFTGVALFERYYLYARIIASNPELVKEPIPSNRRLVAAIGTLVFAGLLEILLLTLLVPKSEVGSVTGLLFITIPPILTGCLAFGLFWSWYIPRQRVVWKYQAMKR